MLCQNLLKINVIKLLRAFKKITATQFTHFYNDNIK